MKTVLVTGGLGYIGKIVVKHLHKEGYNVIILDKKDKIKNKNIEKYCKKIYLNIDIKNAAEVFGVFIANKIDIVVHLAGEISVAESEHNATKYYNNNVLGSINILDAMVCFNVKRIIFASTASVYGNMFTDGMVSESSRTRPVNVYARTKLIVEDIMKDYKNIHSINYTALRFFNVAGADLDNEFGEDHKVEEHLIPNMLSSNDVTIFGNDYDTPDGTCVRDYVHVQDLAEAVLLSIKQKHLPAVNIGAGKTYSNLEIVNTIEKITKNKKNITFGARRPGDPDHLQSDISLANNVLGFNPQYSDINTIIKTAYNWHKK